MPDPFTVAKEYGPGRGPGPKTQPEHALSELLGSQRLGVLASTKKDGHPHLATMSYVWDPESRIIRITPVDGRIKTRHVRRDPRAALHVTTPDYLAFAVAEGTAEVSPPSTVPGDATGRELLAMHPLERAEDEAAYLKNMVEDHRVVIRLSVTHLYGGGLDA